MNEVRRNQAAPSVVVPGNLDGVHRGHQHLLSQAIEIAKHRNLLCIALSFEPHPVEIFAPELSPRRLLSMERKIDLLTQFGAQEVSIQNFDKNYAEQSAAEFIQNILIDELNAKTIVSGSTFRFGKNRSGGMAELTGAGLEVVQAETLTWRNERISSSRIRQCIETGDLKSATEQLGRVHELTGVVKKGDQRGRTLGFPTANLDTGRLLLPKTGVYAVAVRILDDPNTPLQWGVTNIGVRPTFVDAGPTVEVHLLDWHEELYGKTLRLGLYARLRDEKRFSSVQSLIKQIEKDVQQSRRCHSKVDSPSFKFL